MEKSLRFVFILFFGFSIIPLFAQVSPAKTKGGAVQATRSGMDKTQRVLPKATHPKNKKKSKTPSAIPPAVVVSKYCNKSTPPNEWIEFLVIADNTDITNWKFADDNQTQSSIQNRTYFTNNPLWTHLRAGTVIVVWVGTHPVQTYKKDGYIEVSGDNTTYFSGGCTVNIAGSGDIIHLFDLTSLTVAHNKLGHGQIPPNFTAGPSWLNAPPEPKLNYSGSLTDTYAVMVSPGDIIDHYGYVSAGTQDGTLWAAVKSNGDAIKGLPNPQNPNNLTYPASANSDFWRKLRQPTWTAPSLTFTYDPANTKVTLNWNAATDLYPADGTQGYMIVRNTVNTFGDPVDGHTYNLGEAVTGGGTVIDTVNSSQTLTRLDNTSNPSCGGFYYRVYAFRYTKDAVQVNDYNVARGRAYNETSFASGNAVFPDPVASTSATSTPDNFCVGTVTTITLSVPDGGGLGATLKWYAGGCGTGTSIGTGNNLIIPAPATNTTYYARWEAPCTNSACVSVTVTVNPLITPTFTQIGPLCQNSTPAALPPNSTNTPPIIGTWNPATINTTVIGTSSYTFTPATGECASTTTMDITILMPITPTFVPIGELCLNSTPPGLPSSSTNIPPIAGTWNPATISTTTAGTSTYTFTPAAGECAIIATMDITIVLQITPTFPQIGPLCLNSSPPVLPPSSTNIPAITGTWNPATINTTSAGTTTYTFTPDAGQCAGITTMDITIDLQITPTFAQIGPLCMNSTAPALPPGSTNIPPITGTWNPATISTAAAGTATYTFTPDAGQCGVVSTMDITIDQQITPTFTTIGPICKNGNAPALPSTSINGITGAWAPTTISTTTVGTTTYTFTPGAGQCGAVVTMDITISAAITPTFTSIGPLCLNSAAPTLPANSTNGITGTWTPTTIITSAVGTTTYTFTPDAGQCGAVLAMDITISSEIIPTFTAISPICHNNTAPSLPATSTNNITGTWVPTTISTVTVGTTTYTFTPDPGQCGAVATINITISSEITPTFDAIGPLCQKSTAPALLTTSLNGITGVWSPTTINTDVSGTAIYTFTPGAGLGQCAVPTTLSITTTLAIVPTIAISGSPATICEGSNINLTSVVTGEGTSPVYQWIVDGISVGTNSSTYSYTPADGDKVWCHMNSNLACTSNPSYSDTISISVSPAPQVKLTDKEYLCSGIQTQLDAGPAFTKYLWQDDSKDRYYTASDNGQYWVSVTDVAGCTGRSDTVLLKVCETGINVPTAFSPNNDGINDLFKAVATLDEKTSFSLSVIDRWGETVFESHDINIGWDGSFGGQLLPPGTYVWIIVYQSVNSTSKPTSLKGIVTLVR